MAHKVKQEGNNYPIERWVNKALKFNEGFALCLTLGKDYYCKSKTLCEYLWAYGREHTELDITCKIFKVDDTPTTVHLTVEKRT